VVCAVAGEEVLSAPVLPVRLDPRGATHCGHPVLPHHTELVPRYRYYTIFLYPIFFFIEKKN
jgi:hypothetical protein